MIKRSSSLWPHPMPTISMCFREEIRWQYVKPLLRPCLIASVQWPSQRTNELEACLLKSGHIPKDICQVWYQFIKALLRNSSACQGRTAPYVKNMRNNFWHGWCNDTNCMEIGQNMLKKLLEMMGNLIRWKLWSYFPKSVYKLEHLRDIHRSYSEGSWDCPLSLYQSLYKNVLWAAIDSHMEV